MNFVGFNKHQYTKCSTHIWLRVAVILYICLDNNMYVSADNRRPLYIIAHMVNSIYELDEYLGRGANAIEADLTFYSNGTIAKIYHGYPCDCLRVCDESENFATYLNHVRNIVNPNHSNYKKDFSLLFLDLKLSEVLGSQKYEAGEEIAKHLIAHLWNEDLDNPRISVLLSIGNTSDSDAIRGVQDTFAKLNRGSTMERLGFDVGLDYDLSSIQRMWSDLGVTANRWQGDGVIANCLRVFRDDRRLRQVVRIRNSDTGFIEKAYEWTVDVSAKARHSLRVGVDGIITNFPERIVSVLQEPEFRRKYRFATKDDNPFLKVQVAPMKRNHPGPNLDTYMSSAGELTTALKAYMWDFYKLKLKKKNGTLFNLVPALRRPLGPF